MRAQGYVKWFDPDKGYGFIIGQDGQEYFVHYSFIRGSGYRTLERDQEVFFDISEDEKGRRRALDVEPITR